MSDHKEEGSMLSLVVTITLIIAAILLSISAPDIAKEMFTDRLTILLSIPLAILMVWAVTGGMEKL